MASPASPFNTAAWALRAKSRPFVVSSAPYRAPPPGHVAIKVHCVAINPIDWIMQDQDIFGAHYPAIFGSDLAGEVVQTGEGVVGLFVGQKVIAYVLTPSSKPSFGCLASNLYHVSSPCTYSSSLTPLTQPRPRPLNQQPLLRRFPTIRPRAHNLRLPSSLLHPLPKRRRPPPLNLHRSRRPLPTPLPLPPLPHRLPHPSAPHRHNLGRILQRRLHRNPTRPRLRSNHHRCRQRAERSVLPRSGRKGGFRLPLSGRRRRPRESSERFYVSGDLPRRGLRLRRAVLRAGRRAQRGESAGRHCARGT